MAQELPTREDRASRALRNGITRARKHIAAGNLDQAMNTLAGASQTARAWLMGTHSQIHRARPPQ
jgi:hypothetical protein